MQSVDLLRSAVAIDALAPQWRELAAASAEPNAFHEAPLVRAAWDHPSRSRHVQVWTLRDGRGRLDGLVPMERSRTYLGAPLPHFRVWRHPYAYYTAPLMRSGREEAVWTALLGWMAARGGSGGMLHLPALDANGAAWSALTRLSRSGRAQVEAAHRFERAHLQSALSGQDYINAHIKVKRRREHRRFARRLGDVGEVRFTASRDPAELPELVQRFIALEAAGWKGADHTAFATRVPDRRFLEALAARAGVEGRFEVLTLWAGDRVAAMKLNLLCPPGSYAFKIAYDEDLAQHSPGVLLELHNLERVLDDPALSWMDSCADPGHPMIERLWAERRTVVRANVALPSLRGTAAMRAAGLLQQGERGLRARWADLDPEVQQRVRRIRGKVRR